MHPRGQSIFMCSRFRQIQFSDYYSDVNIGLCYLLITHCKRRKGLLESFIGDLRVIQYIHVEE